MGLQREQFLIRACYVPAMRHVLRRFAHGNIGIGKCLQVRIGREIEAALWNHGHRFNAHTKKSVTHAGLDLRRRDVHGLHRRAAEAVHRHAAHGLGQAGQQTDDPCQVVTLRGLGIGAAEDHVFQQHRVQAGAMHEALHDLGGQRIGTYFGQAPLAGEMEW